MKYEFGIAYQPHSSGASAEYLTKQRFTTYQQAYQASLLYDDGFPDIYLIVNDKYVFACKPFDYSIWNTFNENDNLVYCLFKIKAETWGQIETKVWWEEFIKAPEKFFHLASRVLD